MSGNSSEITLIGPLPPLRGGIPKHTKNLYFSTTEQSKIRVRSPKKLYPKIFYPGNSQIDKDLAAIGDNHVRYLSKLGIARQILLGKFSGPALIVWWTPALAAWTILWSLMLRLRRIKVVFLCHNVEPHEKSFFGTLLSKTVLRLGDAHIVQSDQEEQALHKLGIRGEVAKLAHPVESPKAQHHINSGPEKNQYTFLTIGFVRKYKNVPFLMRAFSELDDKNATLRVVGEIWSKELRQEIFQLASLDTRITVLPNYLSDEAFNEEISKADCVVLPYKEVTGSGILADALAFNKKIITSDLEGFVQIAATNSRLSTYKSGSGKDLITAMRNASQDDELIDDSNQLLELSWEQYAKNLLEFLDRFESKQS